MLAIAAAGLALRLWHYQGVPGPHDNPDEVQFAWAGLSLLFAGVPISWSMFPEYGHSTPFLFTDGAIYPLVRPWFDHPPLFALLTGGAAAAAGQLDFAGVTTAAVRVPAVVLSAACVPLAYRLGARVSSPGAALFGAAALATAPGAVLFSRAVEPEALLAPLLLAGLIAAHAVVVDGGRRAAVAVVLGCCLVAPLVKVPGILVALTLALLLLVEGHRRLAVAAVAAGAAGLGIFALYGLAYDWRLFAGVFAEQAAHREGVMGAFEFITAEAGLNRRFRDPWWLLGWLAVLLVAARSEDRRASLFLAWPLAAYAAGMLVLADSRVSTFGWYRITVYPEAYLLAGLAAWRALREPDLAGVTLLLVTGGAAAATAWLGGATALGVASASLAGAAGLAVLLAIATGRRRVASAALIVTPAGLLAGNVWASLQLDQLYLRL